LTLFDKKSVLLWVAWTLLGISSVAAALPTDEATMAAVKECEGVLVIRIPEGRLRRPAKTAHGEVVDIEAWPIIRHLELNLQSPDPDQAEKAARALSELPGGDRTVKLFVMALKDYFTRSNAIVAFRSWIVKSDASPEDVISVLSEVLNEKYILATPTDSLLKSMTDKVSTWNLAAWRMYFERVSVSENEHEIFFFVDLLRRFNVLHSVSVDGIIKSLSVSGDDVRKLQSIRMETSVSDTTFIDLKFQTLGLNGIPYEEASVKDLVEKYRTPGSLDLTSYEAGLNSLNPEVRQAAGYGLSAIAATCSDVEFIQIVPWVLKSYSFGKQDRILNIIGSRIFNEAQVFGDMFVPEELNSENSILQTWAMKTLYKLPNQNVAYGAVRNAVRLKGSSLKSNLYKFSNEGTDVSQTWMQQALYQATVKSMPSQAFGQ
jgi:hypothetical protein